MSRRKIEKAVEEARGKDNNNKKWFLDYFAQKNYKITSAQISLMRTSHMAQFGSRCG